LYDLAVSKNYWVLITEFFLKINFTSFIMEDFIDFFIRWIKVRSLNWLVSFRLSWLNGGLFGLASRIVVGSSVVVGS